MADDAATKDQEKQADSSSEGSPNGPNAKDDAQPEGAAQAAASAPSEEKQGDPSLPPPGEKRDRKKLSRRTLRAQGRKKRKKNLQEFPEFAKAFFTARSKRSTDKKVAFRKRYAKQA